MVFQPVFSEITDDLGKIKHIVVKIRFILAKQIKQT